MSPRRVSSTAGGQGGSLPIFHHHLYKLSDVSYFASAGVLTLVHCSRFLTISRRSMRGGVSRSLWWSFAFVAQTFVTPKEVFV